ncbi:uncharacterized protein N7503_011889 [Penicillium pulvis]|uniref:uncharacterized protein n=1 Tax=Penicillium pulvis TaxID=1562058 RepID=UPI0025466182|nr:uncharacterized protein N7503_011889 [Penicillium pulvis]KAJ5786677.1 hypothetical protein N7503_011889 [Penicillium pulvis]
MTRHTDIFPVELIQEAYYACGPLPPTGKMHSYAIFHHEIDGNPPRTISNSIDVGYSPVNVANVRAMDIFVRDWPLFTQRDFYKKAPGDPHENRLVSWHLTEDSELHLEIYDHNGALWHVLYVELWSTFDRPIESFLPVDIPI